MTDCSSCGAPLPANSIICAYCGTRNSVDLTGLDKIAVVEPQSPRKCPECRKHMQTINVGHSTKFLIEKCEKCHGLFFDPGELDSLLDARVIDGSRVNYNRIKELAKTRPQNRVAYRPCPVCSRMMNRMNFGTRSGVIIDRCREHGIFLDGGELRQLLEWRRAGGQLLHERAQKAKEKEKQKREEEQKKKEAATRQFIAQHDYIYGDRESSAIDIISSLFSKIFG